MTRRTRLRIALAVATAGRPAILRETLATLGRQVRAPDRLLVCAPSAAEAEGAAAVAPAVETIVGARGLPLQRNAILDRCGDCDVVLFLDDDFVMAPTYLAALEAIHRRHPDVAMVTGDVVLDGVTRGGVTVAAALAVLGDAAPTSGAAPPEEVYNGYGCNMSARIDLVARHRIRFDETLPAYGWLEDVDFSRSLARYGRIVRSRDLRGVHLGVRTARQAGTRLGYSQIANPIHILRKGNLTPRRALAQMGRNVSANLLRSLRPDPYVDRRGRVAGNVRAFLDLLRGRLAPDRALHL